MQPDFRSLLDKLSTVNNTVNINEAWSRWTDFLVETKDNSCLHEADEVKTKTRSKVADMFQDTDRKQMAAQKKRTPDATFSPERRTKKAVQLKKAVPMPDLAQIEKNLPKADTDDDLGDLDTPMPQLGQETPLELGHDEQPIDDTALATVSSELAERIREIEWNDLKDLPGFAKQTIRNMGRQVFAAFGEVTDDQIQVISSITHDEQDLDLVAGMVRQIGKPVLEDAVVDFQDVMPGYKAYVGVYAFTNHYYMFVKDDFGEYIYSWDNQATHSKLGHQEPIDAGEELEQLESVNEDTFGTNELEGMNYRGFTYDPEVDSERSLKEAWYNPFTWFDNNKDTKQEFDKTKLLPTKSIRKAGEQLRDRKKLMNQQLDSLRKEMGESVNEDTFGTNELEGMNYRGFTYDPEVEDDGDRRVLIHHVLDPQGKRIRTPVSFNNAPGRGWEYVTADEFKHVVNLYISQVSSGIA